MELTESQLKYQQRREEARQERITKLRRLMEEHPNESLAWYAEQLKVTLRTVQRDVKQLGVDATVKRLAERAAERLAEARLPTQELERRMMALLEAQRAEYEEKLAEYKARLASYEAKLVATAAEKEEIERRLEAQADKTIQSGDAYFQRILEESGWEIVVTDQDEDLIWQGFSCHIPANTPTRVQGIFAGMLHEVKRARQERDRIIDFYRRG